MKGRRQSLALNLTSRLSGETLTPSILLAVHLYSPDRSRNTLYLSSYCAGMRWNGLLDAVSTYISGAEWDRVSAKDFDRYEDTGVNWHVVVGLGTIVAAYEADLPVMLDCQVRAIDRRGKRLRIETSKGAIAADQAIVAVPTTLLAARHMRNDDPGTLLA